jgi:hypothetical protein
VLVAIGVTASIVLVIVFARVMTGQAGFTETDAARRIAQQQREIEQLDLRIAQLRSPQRIYDRALELGLVPADHVTFLSPKPTASATAKSSPAATGRRTPSGSPSSPKRGNR